MPALPNRRNPGAALDGNERRHDASPSRLQGVRCEAVDHRPMRTPKVGGLILCRSETVADLGGVTTKGGSDGRGT